MIELKYNIPSLMSDFHGVRSLMLFYPGLSFPKAQQQLLANYPEVKVISHDDLETEQCYLGTPVFFPVTFQSGQYNIYKEGKIDKIQMDDFRLPLATLVTFRRKKRSSETPIVAGTGSITETYSLENWDVDFWGLCLDEPQHPQGADTFIKQHDRLIEFEQIVDAIKVKGDLFTRKHIYSLKINEITFQPTQGKPRVLSFMLSCSSIEPIELIIK